MEIAKIIYLLEESLSKKASEVDTLGRQHQAERSTLANDLKMLATIISKHSSSDMLTAKPDTKNLE